MAFDHEADDENCNETVYTLVSCSVQVLFDIIFLGLRLGLCLGYGKNASIFISKSIIFIIVYLKRIFNLFFASDGSDDDPSENQQQAESSESSITSSSRPSVLGVNNSSVAPAPQAPSAPPMYNPQRVRLSYVVHS